MDIFRIFWNKWSFYNKEELLFDVMMVLFRTMIQLTEDDLFKIVGVDCYNLNSNTIIFIPVGRQGMNFTQLSSILSQI